MNINKDQYMYEIYKEAENCKYNMMRANTFDHETFYKNSLNEKLYEISNLLENDSKAPRQQEFTLKELSKYNGTSGNASYVSVNRIVYDVSAIQPWAGGVHFGITAGNDVTENFMTCHGDLKILNKLPVVGVLKIQ